MPAPRMKAASFFEARKKDTADSLKWRPNIFTEQGVTMLSSVLNSDIDIIVNLQIIRISFQNKKARTTNEDLLKKMEKLEKRILTQGQTANKHEECNLFSLIIINNLELKKG